MRRSTLEGPLEAERPSRVAHQLRTAEAEATLELGRRGPAASTAGEPAASKAATSRGSLAKRSQSSGADLPFEIGSAPAVARPDIIPRSERPRRRPPSGGGAYSSPIKGQQQTPPTQVPPGPPPPGNTQSPPKSPWEPCPPPSPRYNGLSAYFVLGALGKNTLFGGGCKNPRKTRCSPKLGTLKTLYLKSLNS